MSGGAFNYVNHHSPDAWITEHDSVELFESLLKRLEEYGEPAKKAIVQTKAFVDRLKEVKEEISKAEFDLYQLQNPLAKLMLAVDYHQCGDWGKESVLEELEKINQVKDDQPEEKSFSIILNNDAMIYFFGENFTAISKEVMDPLLDKMYETMTVLAATIVVNRVDTLHSRKTWKIGKLQDLPNCNSVEIGLDYKTAASQGAEPSWLSCNLVVSNDKWNSTLKKQIL